MSYNRHHGGGRRRNRDDDYEDRRREFVETPEQKLRTGIIKFGDVDADVELLKFSQQLRELTTPNVQMLAEGFRLGVTEQPYKIPHYASLLCSLNQGADAETGGSSLRIQILEDFWKGFQASLDKLSWREVRLCVHFFAHLTCARIISASSMLALLQSFTAVLEEFGVSHGRAKHAALCAAEGLMRAGLTLKKTSASDVSQIINSIQTYADTSVASKALVCPVVTLHSSSTGVEGTDEVLDVVLSVLNGMNADDFNETICLQPYLATLDDDEAEASPLFDLPPVLVPPEVIELDNMTANGSDSSDQGPKKDEWPEYNLRLFDNDVTADPTTASGYIVRSTIADITNIFEVNRKECARLLLELPRWMIPGLFKPKPGTVDPEDEGMGKNWQLESCVIETILGKMFVFPEATYRSVYYFALITELCKLSPTTVGPAVGKSIRRLYGMLSDGLDVEAARRFTEWFAVHMSNFGFQWVWKEWIPDLSLTLHHPKRNFIRRAVETEIRLSYYDRIVNTLPEAFHLPENRAIPDQAPGPEFDYDDPLRPHHDVAQSILNLFRGRSKAEDVIAHIETLKNTMAESAEGDVNVDSVIRLVTMQSLLHIGSRSFSHFLNAIERYLPVLRSLASSSDAKADLLTAVVDFWRRGKQTVSIVFDKLMQYQIVDPTDVVAWAFSSAATGGAEHRMDTFRWEVMKGAIDKANGRVAVAKKKIATLRKEQDDDRARAKARDTGDVGSMEVEPDAQQEENVADSPALMTALKAYAVLTREQNQIFSRTLNEYVNILSKPSTILNEKAWHNRANWSDDDWENWETWGWYRNFCRMYSPYLRNFAATLSTIAFEKIEGSNDEAALLLKRVWNVALGQES